MILTSKFLFFRYDGTWSLEAAQKRALSGDLGLVLKDKAKHSAISSHLSKPFIFKDQAFIVQYEIMFQVIVYNSTSGRICSLFNQIEIADC